MKKINWQKIIINTVTFGLVAFIYTNITFGDPGTIDNPIEAESLSEFFSNIVSVAIQLGTIISVLGIMYGGFQYVSAQGDEEKLGKARNTVTWALVGTAVLLGARTIMEVVEQTVKDLS